MTQVQMLNLLPDNHPVLDHEEAGCVGEWVGNFNKPFNIHNAKEVSFSISLEWQCQQQQKYPEGNYLHCCYN